MLKPTTTKRTDLAKRLQTRVRWVGAMGLACVLFAPHWAGSLIVALFTLFVMFAIDDEAQSLEQDH